jgi:hypothetical protein
MVSNEQNQSTDTSQIDDTVEEGFDETKISSPDSTFRNSRFFRTKRKQRLATNQADTKGITCKNSF